MFKRLFKKHNSRNLSKVDYWKKWELFELFDNLNEVEKLLNDIAKDKQSNELEKFRSDFIEELYEIKGDNVADFTAIWKWFMPTKEWDTFAGQNGKKIGDNIFRITDKWKRNQDFLVGTKVSLQNEFGVVLEKTEGNNLYGLIRWDTDRVNGVEDWRGLFGSFLQAGGQVINQDHEFRFINDDGTMKKASS
ncbi:hypothetical protein [Flavihumibacter petaseus]|uniref:Uncharacterized protein n=1 Tax=Flavihumibacter petaseus NBRC 106054 TaxID=1220578 RepID=A0A0E9N4Q9_9BACT|nr:hypothetical protein [Flavihumibacter petaseus]GAO44783.1 hypothetical protein FPE01S_04_00260 [Flavihumibacter petaseus NBRC 106054]